METMALHRGQLPLNDLESLLISLSDVRKAMRSFRRRQRDLTLATRHQGKLGSQS